ncbi:hypothetical protein EV421DRAFT_1674491, partial [Armillaria borealis]
LSMLIKVNRLEGRALWDSGSTSMLMFPAFASIAKAITFQLVQPITLQLGTIESRSKINHRTNCFLEMSGCKSQEYFDVVNLDQYDLLIGTPFMHKHRVILDFGQKCIIING